MVELDKKQKAVRPGFGRIFPLGMAQINLPGLKTHIVFWSVTLLGIALDLWTKSVVFSWLQHQPDQRFEIIDGFLHFVMALNLGAAFGMAPGQRCLLIAISVIALIAILAVFLFGGTRQRLLHVALGLFTAGVCGNLYDRIFNDGLVRDFIDVVIWPGTHWPAFNVADSMLCIAVGLLLISTLFTGTSSQKRGQQHR